MSRARIQRNKARHLAAVRARTALAAGVSLPTDDETTPVDHGPIPMDHHSDTPIWAALAPADPDLDTPIWSALAAILSVNDPGPLAYEPWPGYPPPVEPAPARRPAWDASSTLTAVVDQALVDTRLDVLARAVTVRAFAAARHAVPDPAPVPVLAYQPPRQPASPRLADSLLSLRWPDEQIEVREVFAA